MVVLHSTQVPLNSYPGCSTVLCPHSTKTYPLVHTSVLQLLHSFVLAFLYCRLGTHETVGLCVGLNVGFVVGFCVGLNVGFVVGFCVGDVVGLVAGFCYC